MQTCKRCEREKPTSAFPVRGKNRRTQVRRSPYCQECTATFHRDIYLNGTDTHE